MRCATPLHAGCSIAQIARFLKMAEQADQNDQWNRHTEQQQDNRSHLDISLPAMAGF
jgi:hypothetical protein